MKIAVPYDNGEVFGHFGKTEQFKVYTVENDKIASGKVLSTNGNGHGALSQLLSSLGISRVICGGIGEGAKNALASAGIELDCGVTGNADESVRAYLGGTLVSNPDFSCGHHEHAHGHSCGNHHD